MCHDTHAKGVAEEEKEDLKYVIVSGPAITIEISLAPAKLGEFENQWRRQRHGTVQVQSIVWSTVI